MQGHLKVHEDRDSAKADLMQDRDTLFLPGEEARR